MASLAAHIYVKLKLKPRDPELDNYYHEFEDSHPQLARYSKWSRITFAAVALGIALVFLATVI